MEKLLEKLTSYNLFNYLLPGIIFSVLLEKTTSYSIIHKDIIIEAFLAYFLGLIISRVSSVIVEPLLKKIKFVKFADYKDFVLASESDKKIELLSESNNMYRVFISLFFILMIIVLYEKLLQDILMGYTSYIVIIGLLILFLFSYKKQTSYITRRIEIFKNKQNKENINE
ncbi:MAG: Unknown protein [uncultured Sulfurovum sp.]|uniref:Phosphohistidine phosphatase n=1 Tax=uncultured Sulfurovum sp. TaxID=269237 RepID=A0A6S6SN90_9BACT|nr:MAG: Unknown protein [uncultured Sulfurovum sp.]